MLAPVPQADGVEPRPADLEAPVLGAQGEQARRADGLPGCGEHRRERDVEPRIDPAGGLVHPGLPLPRASAAGRSAASARSADRATPPRGRRRGVARAARAARRGPRASVSASRSTGSRQYTRADADLRVRVHGVRGPLRRARPQRRPGDHLPVVQRDRRAEADLGLRRPRRCRRSRPSAAAAGGCCGGSCGCG